MSTQFTSIHNILIDAMTEYLTNALIEETTDETKVGLIRFGKLQADPTDADRGLNILVHTGGEDWPDVLNTDDSNSGYWMPTYEIGGTQYWRRRFVIELELFFDGENDRDNARKKAVVITGNAHTSLFKMPVPQGHDSFGEAAMGCQVLKSHQNESGGEGTFIWRSFVFVEWFTVIQPGFEDA